jgi:hypothetical protein
MPINYALFENSLTTDPNDYYATVQIAGTADLDTIAARISENGSVLAKADILAVLEASASTIATLLTEGQRVNFGGVCDLVPTIQGTFSGQTDSFDPSRHRVTVGGGPGYRVRSTVEDTASVAKVEGVKPAPSPIAYRDFQSNTENDILTPGSIGTLVGYRLKINPTAADEGLFILNGTTGAVVTRIANFQKNKPAELVWLNPLAAALPAGNYRLEVRARLRGGDELRSGTLSQIIRRV